MGCSIFNTRYFWFTSILKWIVSEKAKGTLFILDLLCFDLALFTHSCQLVKQRLCLGIGHAIYVEICLHSVVLYHFQKNVCLKG